MKINSISNRINQETIKLLSTLGLQQRSNTYVIADWNKKKLCACAPNNCTACDYLYGLTYSYVYIPGV